MGGWLHRRIISKREMEMGYEKARPADARQTMGKRVAAVEKARPPALIGCDRAWQGMLGAKASCCDTDTPRGRREAEQPHSLTLLPSPAHSVATLL